MYIRFLLQTFDYAAVIDVVVMVIQGQCKQKHGAPLLGKLRSLWNQVVLH